MFIYANVNTQCAFNKICLVNYVCKYLSLGINVTFFSRLTVVFL